MKKKTILTIKEAAACIDGLTEHRVRQMCKNGQLHCFMAGKKFLIDEDELYRVVFGRNSKNSDYDKDEIKFEPL